MKSFFRIQRTRYTAAVMLFVWLMTLGISVANACLVPQDDGSSGFFNQVQTAPDHFATNTVHSDEHTPSPDKITCLQFCVAGQSTVITAHQDGPAHLDLAPVLFLTGLLVPVTDQPSPAQAFTSPSWSEPLVSIRYLRLTI